MRNENAHQQNKGFIRSKFQELFNRKDAAKPNRAERRAKKQEGGGTGGDRLKGIKRGRTKHIIGNFGSFGTATPLRKYNPYKKAI